jgi:hypothetical protein
MTPICLQMAANSRGPDLFHWPNLFDEAVIRRPLEWLLVTLIDRLGAGSGSWSR